MFIISIFTDVMELFLLCIISAWTYFHFGLFLLEIISAWDYFCLGLFLLGIISAWDYFCLGLFLLGIISTLVCFCLRLFLLAIISAWNYFFLVTAVSMPKIVSEPGFMLKPCTVRFSKAIYGHGLEIASTHRHRCSVRASSALAVLMYS